MLSIKDGLSLARALNSPLDPRIKSLIQKRRDQLGDITNEACFIIIQASDTAAQLERELGFSILKSFAEDTHFGEPGFSPCFEWVLDHQFAYECTIILTDDGYAHVVILENTEDTDPELKALCEAYAEATV